MDFENFRFEYVSGPRPFAISTPVRLLGAIALMLAVCGMGGCVASQMRATTNRPVDASMTVFVRASIEQHTMDSVCLFPCASPPEMASAAEWVTTSFQSRLVQRRPFREIRAVPSGVKSDSEAIWYARNEGCTLVMRPSILKMQEGTGAMTTELSVRTRILDARTGQVLWDLKQDALSQPGADIDLCWNTVTGEPAQRCFMMADYLAQRLAEYLAGPLEKAK
jgi:hypothetical protein